MSSPGGAVQQPADVVGVVAEVFTWAGFGVGALFGILALVLHLSDGTWLPVRAVVEEAGDGHVVRWIDADGGVNEAPLSPHDRARIGDHDMADIFYRSGWRNRMRLTPGSPAVRGASLLAAGLAALGLVALIVSWVLLATQQ